MPKLPIVSGAEAVKALQLLWFFVGRQRGSHVVLENEKANDYGAHGDGNYIYLENLAGGTYEIFTRSGD